MGIIESIQVIISNPFFVKYGLIGLFLNGLLAAVIPIPTELTAIALLATGESRLVVYVVLATSSILGGFLAYYLGSSGKKAFNLFHRKPKVKDENRSYHMLKKYGWVAIFFCCWIPVIGDFIPIVAGSTRYDFRKFAIAMSAGKAIKFVATVYISGFLAVTFFH